MAARRPIAAALPGQAPEAPAAPLAQEIIRRKRDGRSLSPDEIAAFVQGLARGTVSDAQAAAFAMAVLWRGMAPREAVALTRAMADSGERLQWQGVRGIDGPVLDKHSSGGIGDTVSLMLGPMLAACGGFVPMISGRGLGHTGGTLDKLEALPGYTVLPSRATLLRTVREAGVAIVGAGPHLAPADRRLYAVRDVTATVESVPLIVASILSKKLAAGLGFLVLDVKWGNGAFMRTRAAARALATQLVAVGRGAGLPTEALVTDMNQPLAPAAGNALEVRVALDYLRGGHARAEFARLHGVTLALGAVALRQAGLDGAAPRASSAEREARSRARLEAALASGAAAERFARMVAGLGGPADLLERPERHLPRASVVREVRATGAAGARVQSIDTRALGLAVVALGGGRRRAEDRIDPAVGLDALAPLGAAAGRGELLARVHAADGQAADAAEAAVRAAYHLGPGAPAATPLVAQAVRGAAARRPPT